MSMNACMWNSLNGGGRRRAHNEGCARYLLNCADCARLGVPKFHWFSSAPKSVPAFPWDRLGASIEFPVIPKRAQYAQFGCQCTCTYSTV